MNEVFVIGKVIGNIEFKFILNSKDISIVKFTIELQNKGEIKIKAYNELADYVYSKIKEKSIVAIRGKLNNKMEIIVKKIEKIG